MNIANVLNEQGPLAKMIAGFSPRKAQQEMAQAIFKTLQHNEVLITEAGTGTGKTFAYLVPAVLAGKHVIISTGTKTLQDQLFYHDLPIVRKALARPIVAELLKGRSNYLCLYRLHRHQALYKYAALAHRIKVWAGKSRYGDLSELNNIPEDHPVRPYISSTADNCIGQDCEFYDECFVLQARRRAQAADIVVVNHHLLFADMALKESGFGELLPATEGIIIDEAHQIAEVASGFFGVSLSTRQLLELCRDVIVAQVAEAGDMGDLTVLADALEKSVKDVRLVLGVEVTRLEWIVIKNNAEKWAVFTNMMEALSGLEQLLAMAAPRGKAIDNCWQRAKDFAYCLQLFAAMEEEWIYWLETYPKSFTLHLTPIQIADTFRQQMQRYHCAWIFTSATLTVNNDFSHFSKNLGITANTSQHWDSPFNFQQQALLYLPKRLPEPHQPHYIKALIDLAIPVMNASQGRTFMLFTSYRSLNEAAMRLKNNIEYPLLIQGTMPRPQLLEKFKQLGNAILLGTSSFWEGVDVRGQALSCVIIDKLPFASPGDPVLKARIQALKQSGGEPFMEYQLPHAVIALKQGVGRLIRDMNDYGVVMLCDPRLLNRRYGQVFLDSLPKMQQVNDIVSIQNFFMEKNNL